MMPVASLPATLLTRTFHATGNTLYPHISYSLADITPKRRDSAFKIEGRVLERFLHHLASARPSTWSCRSSVARSAGESGSCGVVVTAGAGLDFASGVRAHVFMPRTLYHSGLVALTPEGHAFCFRSSKYSHL